MKKFSLAHTYLCITLDNAMKKRRNCFHFDFTTSSKSFRNCFLHVGIISVTEAFDCNNKAQVGDEWLFEKFERQFTFWILHLELSIHRFLSVVTWFSSITTWLIILINHTSTCNKLLFLIDFSCKLVFIYTRDKNGRILVRCSFAMFCIQSCFFL